MQRSTMGRLGRVPWVAAASVLALASCGGGQSEESVGDLTIYVHESSILSSSGEDSLLQGELVVRDGCVLLAQDAGELFPVVWPSGTSIGDDDPFTLALTSGLRVEVGQRVSGGGGTHPATSERVGVDIKDECFASEGPDNDLVIVFNPDEKLTVED
jgi:hypothetical protein